MTMRCLAYIGPTFEGADNEYGDMCLDVMLRHIVLQFARVTGTFGAFTGRLPK
jgi:hypothetical protein